jgi:hypothetical protein
MKTAIEKFQRNDPPRSRTYAVSYFVKYIIFPIEPDEGQVPNCTNRRSKQAGNGAEPQMGNIARRLFNDGKSLQAGIRLQRVEDSTKIRLAFVAKAE